MAETKSKVKKDEVNASDKTNEKEVKLTKAQKRAAKTKGLGNKIRCVHHGKELVEDRFYQRNEGSVFAGVEKLPICKECIYNIYNGYYHDHNKDVVTAVYLTCRKIDVKFDITTCQAAIKKSNGNDNAIFTWYMQQYNSLVSHTEVANFDHSDAHEFGNTFEEVINNIQSSTKLNADDKRNFKQIKKRLGYDPFDGMGLNEYQLSKCYSELIGWLDADEELADDPYKINVIIQLINSNMQLRNVDLFIATLSNNISNFQDNISFLSTLNSTKSKLVDAVTKIVDKNKWLTSDGATTKNKLTVMMKRYREMGFDADANYFDLITAEGVRKVMDLSNRSLAEEINFGDEEAKEVIMMQRKLIIEKDEEIAGLFEKNRKTALRIKAYREKYGELDDSQ